MIKTNKKKHEKKVEKIKEKLKLLQSEYPDINFLDGNLLRVIDIHRELVKELIYAEVDVTACTEQRYKCSNCICKK
jgi:hypothetical protein